MLRNRISDKKIRSMSNLDSKTGDLFVFLDEGDERLFGKLSRKTKEF